MQKKSPKQSLNTGATPLIFFSMGFALVLLILIILLFKITPDHSLKPIKLATGEWDPFSGSELEDHGITTAIITRVFHDIGYEPEYYFMPWSMAEDTAADGENDNSVIGTFPYSKSQKRKYRFYFSTAIQNIEYAMFYHVENNPAAIKIRKTDDLSKHIVLNIDGYEYPEGITAHISKNKNNMKDNIDAFLQLEKSKEPLIVVESAVVGEQLLEQKIPHLSSSIKKAPLKVNTGIHLMLSKRNPNNLALINAFNNKLEQLKSNSRAYALLQENVKNRIDMARAVLLEPFDKSNLIRAYKTKNKEQVILLPKGSKALVKQWNDPFLRYHSNIEKAEEILVKVKLLNGPFPLKNNNVYVDSRAIRLSR